MWARKRIDIGTLNLMIAFWHFVCLRSTQSSLRAISSSVDKTPLLNDAQSTCIPPLKKQGKLEKNIDFMLSHLVFLPVDLPMPESEITRMEDVVTRYAIPTPAINEHRTD